ncbi:hypothetical protein [Mycolicibacterium porcinum]|uniref:Lipoprotein n=1 Tax=Mycolicibacterium porcinum TaxID=39693 RepID=A0AAW5SY14_9MYCO|nr:hypothetical protein [Mycolicibacterium porcinum]MCV7387293.1 hypothetical protein [Mycolicibacterium porcinum]ORB42713.1 hypothetical protein BST41_08570 [Mycolicibacterium porcinum]
MKQTILRTTLCGLAAFAVIGTAAACSSAESTDSSTQSASTSASSAPESSSAITPDAFGECMQEHGIPAPPEGAPGAPGGPEHPGAPGHHPDGPPPGDGATPPPPPGVDQAQWEEAMQACQSLAPQPPQR